MKDMKSLLSNIAKLAVAAGLIYWLVTSGKIDLESLRLVLHPSYFLLFFAMTLMNIVILSERWRLLLKSQVAHFSFLEVFKLTCMGLFFNFAMPGGVGGDLVKGFYVTRNNKEKRAQSIVTLLMDRLIGLYCMIMVAVLVMTIDINHVLSLHELSLVYVTMISAFLAFTLFFIIALPRRMHKHTARLFPFLLKIPGGKIVVKMIQTIAEYGHDKKSLIFAAGLSFCGQASAIFQFYLVGQVMENTAMSLSQYFIIIPIGYIVTALPITPGGVGVGQAAFFYLFNLYSAQSGVVGTTGITIQQLFSMMLGLYGAYVFIRAKSQLQLNLDNLSSQS